MSNQQRLQQRNDSPCDSIQLKEEAEGGGWRGMGRPPPEPRVYLGYFSMLIRKVLFPQTTSPMELTNCNSSLMPTDLTKPKIDPLLSFFLGMKTSTIFPKELDRSSADERPTGMLLTYRDVMQLGNFR
ncbi:hypothetical protein LXL04_020927 [Taraxacum kok-saghyz]